jgi:hypothetical protein
MTLAARVWLVRRTGEPRSSNKRCARNATSLKNPYDPAGSTGS